MKASSKTTLMSACAAVAVLLLAVSGAQSAQAADPISEQKSGVVVGIIGSSCIPMTGICYPGGTLSVSVSGDKKYIKYQSADVTDLIGTGGSGGYYCNWHIDFSDHDANGQDTYHTQSVNHPGCTGARLERHSFRPRSASPNAVQTCSELWSEGAQVGKVCINLG